MMEPETPGSGQDGFEFAMIIRLADPIAEDEGGSCWKNHDVEVRRALRYKVTKSPYLARQLSVFDDQQPITGYPGQLFGGLRRMQNPAVVGGHYCILRTANYSPKQEKMNNLLTHMHIL
jgi:hypothetical protein